jgi:CRISPR/Cas system-associated exonuclease Cas4 (RecB family)
MLGSYTFYNDFINCPHKAWHKYILKDVPREMTPEMEYGIKVHKQLEDRISKEIELPPWLDHLEIVCDVFDNLSKHVQVRAEYFIGMRLDGTGCAWDDKQVWFRGKLDLAVMAPTTAWLLDWKTGKRREHPFELQCQAMLLHAMHPDITEIYGEYYWMKEGCSGKRYKLDAAEARAKVARLHAQFLRYQGTMYWPKKASPLCAWCPVEKCENWKRRPT